MSQTIEITFNEVQPGEKFISKKTKRCFGGVKIHEAAYLGNNGVFMPNAIILSDPIRYLADDAGTLISFGYTEMVEVTR